MTLRLAAFALVFGACAPDPTVGVFDDDALLAELEGYTTWGSPPGWEGLRYACDADHGPFVRLYANPLAIRGLELGSSLPDGALLVSASFQDPEGTPKLLTAMRKVRGFAPEDDDWYWGQLDEAGTRVAVGGDIPACAACHAASDGHLRHRDGPPAWSPADCD